MFKELCLYYQTQLFVLLNFKQTFLNDQLKNNKPAVVTDAQIDTLIDNF